MKKLPISDEVGASLLSLGKQLIREENSIRDLLIPIWKQAEHYWEGNQNIVWSQSDNGFIGDGLPSMNSGVNSELDSVLYNKVYNIYRSHGESIIAALAQSDLAVQYFPEDADNTNDIDTAAAFSKIEEIIKKDNNADMLLLRALYLLYNFGMVAAYTYNEFDKKYGTYQEEKFENASKSYKNISCPECGNSEDVAPDFPTEEMTCPHCGAAGMPNESDEITEVYQKSVGFEDMPKMRQVIKMFGPLNVTFPQYATEQSEIPYLRYSFETHVTKAMAMFPHIADKIRPGYNDTYERWGRESNAYRNMSPQGLTTVDCYWFRPSTYWGLTEEERTKLQKDFPKGLYLVFVNDILAEAKNESLDDHWVITENPLAKNLHGHAIGSSLIDIQDITNDLLNLTLQTIEFGIPQTYADPEVIDFEKFNEIEARPGQIIPATPKANKTLRDSFETIQTAQLSREVKEFADYTEKAGQFTVGSFPSIYGGNVQGSRTASEYAQSRNQALQRLSIHWKILKTFWSRTCRLAVTEYAGNLRYDVNLVSREGDSFVNSFVRRTELTGSIGRVESETSEAFPLTWERKRDVLMDILAQGNEQIMSVLFSPDNSEIVARILGFPELNIPGKYDRNKQIWEIAQMLKAEAMDGQDEQGNQNYQSTVPIEPQLDDDMIHIQTCKTFLLSPRGIYLKQENPGAYMNIISHMSAHEQNLMMKTMQQSEQTLPGQPPDSATETTAV
jgi:hypothetical protein